VLRADAPALGHGAAGVALKVTDLPSTVHDGYALADVFSEVALLQSFASSPSVCQVHSLSSLVNSRPAASSLMREPRDVGVNIGKYLH